MFGRRIAWALSLVGTLLIMLAAAGIAYLAFIAGVAEGLARAPERVRRDLDLGSSADPPHHVSHAGAGEMVAGSLRSKDRIADVIRDSPAKSE